MEYGPFDSALWRLAQGHSIRALKSGPSEARTMSERPEGRESNGTPDWTRTSDLELRRLPL